MSILGIFAVLGGAIILNVMYNLTAIAERYMEKKDEKIWFPAMKYGVGWGFPITWQGWAVILTYIALMLLGGLFINKSPFLIIPFVIFVFLLSGIFLYICRKKGEKPDTRWGKKL